MLKKGASDVNFYKRNAARISALLPPIQNDLNSYLTRNSRTLSRISGNLGPRIQRANGNYNGLAKQAQIMCAPLLLSDGVGTQRLIKNGKQALDSIDSQQLIQDCMRVIPTLR